MATYYMDENGNIVKKGSEKKKKKKNDQSVTYTTDSNGKLRRVDDDIAPIKTTVRADDDDIAPVKRKEDDRKLDFFQKSLAFDDGWQFGDVTKTILGTLGDAGLEVAKGVGSLVEGVTDAVSYGVAGITDVLGADEFAERTRKRAMENRIEQWTENIDNRFEQNSVLGRTADSILQGVGQVGGIMATGGIAGAAAGGAAAGAAATSAATMATTGLMAVSGFGSGAGEAYKAGATDGEAMAYGLISGAADALTELIFGGLGKAVGAIGLSKGLSAADDMLATKVSGLFTNQIAKNFAEFGIKAGAEGFEEVLAGTAQAIGKKITYMKEEELSEIIKDENLLEQFVVGATTSGMIQSGLIPGTSNGSLKEANKEGRDFITGLNQNEQSVIDKEVEKRVAAQEKGGKKLTKKEIGAIEKQVLEDLDRGGIDIDTIEEVLGGETYSNYKKLADAEAKMQSEYDALGKKEKYTLADDARYKELGERLKYVREKGAKNEMRKRLDDEVSSMVKDSRLSESFAERSRRGQAFEADLTQYNEKQRAIVQKAAESGILNNTRRTHDFVDMVARIGAEKGITFDFANNAKLKESGFAVEGKTVNGYVTKDGITVNIQSAKALDTVVGHEITHVLEGTELYGELQKAAIEYAKTKGDYQGRYDALAKMYDSVKDADIDAELTADIVGEYLFTDTDFINNLSANHRNVFQKIYDEIKYLLKVATAGSKEARQLEQVKRAFEKAYREGGKNKTAEDGGMKYSLTEYSEKQKENWSASKRIVIYDNPQQLSQFIQSSATGETMDKKMYFGAIPPDLAARIKADAGVDVENYNLSLGSYEIRKILKDHGNEAVESPRGQRAIVEDDFAHIVDVVLNPQKIAISENTYMGKPAIIFTGEHNGRMNVIAVVSDKRLDLFVQTIYVNTKKGNLATPTGEQAPVNTPEASSGTVSDTMLPQDSENVKFSLSEIESVYQTDIENGDMIGAELAVERAANLAMPDSKIRGADGSLIPVYHGTREMFYEFDTSVKGGVNGTAEGFGIYTSDDPEVTSAYGDRQIKMYANITKPATSDKKTISPAKLAALIKDTCKKQAQKAVDDGEYDSVQDALMDTWVSNYVYTYGIGMERAYREVAKSILEMNDSDMAVIQEVMSGMAIRDYAEATDFYRNSLIPITGFDGFATHWENSATGKKSNIYLAFDSSQLKSADAVTYDDNGDIIPLAERFDPEKKDIRRSLSPEGARPVSDGNYGRYHVYGRDIALETAEDIAPVAAPAADIAPAVAESAAYEEPLEDESPYAELDQLGEQLEEMERQQEELLAAGEYEKAEALLMEMGPASARMSELQEQIEELEAQQAAEDQERLASFNDEDAPVPGEPTHSEDTDTVTLPRSRRDKIAATARKTLGFAQNRVSEMRELVDKFSQGEIDSEMLLDEIAERFGSLTETDRNEELMDVKRWLRTAPISVSDEIKTSFADYTASVHRPNYGKIAFRKNGPAVDQFYAEASSLYPGYFPADIIQPADQLQKIIDVANMDVSMDQTYELDDQMLQDVVDEIVKSVNEYRRNQRHAEAEASIETANASLASDSNVPAEEDIAPVRADVAPAQETIGNQTIKTMQERLDAKVQHLQTELENTKRQREGAVSYYQRKMAEKKAEYDKRKNKNTKAAYANLRSVERYLRIGSSIDADFAKKISNLEGRVAKASEDARNGESKEVQGAMRKELQAAKNEEIRTALAAEGYDMDTVLANAKNMSTFATVDNTPERVNEKTFGYKVGQIINRLTIDRLRQHTTEGTRWLNSITDRKNGLLAQLSKEYSIKPGSKESEAAQMYAEGYFVDGNGDKVAYGDRELALDFPDAKVQANIKGLAADPRIRQFYDETLARINESRTRNAYAAIKPLQNYFLHFRAMDDFFSKMGIPFNPNDIKAKDLPTDMNGVTADLKPGQPYFASSKHRKGIDTTFDLLGGLERYARSAMPQIYYIDDIQMLRAFRNYIADSFGQAHGLEGLDTMTEEEAAAQIEKVYGSHLSNYARFLTEEANVVAGKTAMTDRAVEGIIGRRGLTALDTLNRQVGANMVGFNVSSSLTNFIAAVQAFSKTNKAAFIKGFAQTVANRIGAIYGKTDGFAENNPTMIRRKGADNFARTPWQKIGDVGYLMMGAVDSLSTEMIVRGKYNELIAKGVSEEQAVEWADKWASRLMGDRSIGQQPQLYNSKTLGIFTKFQLEVRNQLDSMFYDTIQEAKLSNEDIQNAQARNAKTAAQVTATLATLAVTSHLFGKAFESVAGYNPAFDIIEAIIKAFGWDDEEDSEDTVLDNLGQGFMSLLEDMPYSSLITDGGRIPISSALPLTQLIKGEDKYGNEKSRLETIAETVPYYLLPGGYGQIKKTKAGLAMFDEDLPIAGSYTDSGNLRFTVEDTFENRVQAAVFGQWASSNAREYFDKEYKPLQEKQIQELVDSGLPIREYRDYREGLKDLDTLGEKVAYIADLDLPMSTKNLLVNNIADRKDPIDLTDFGEYDDWGEFEYAHKYPKKYDFLTANNISVAQYESFDEDTKAAWSWAYQNPEKFALSKTVTNDVVTYRQYTKELNDITGVKDASGKTISGSRKQKVANYLNNLAGVDYYAKLILFKMEYPSDDTYNRAIIEYLNGRNDISFEEEVTILKELGFTVTADGTVRW